MKDRANWHLPIATLVFVLLLILPSPAAADESAGAPAAALAAASAPTAGTTARETGGSAAPATSKEPVVINKADAVIPNANHYKCYPIRSSSDFIPRRVLLRDQFWTTWVWVWRPRYLCNPVWKTTEDGDTYPPPQPDAHLVCYEIQEEKPTPPWEVKTYDQFGWLALKGDAAELLCLPAAKYVVVPPGG